MIDFRILLPYYIDLNDDTLNSIDKITKDFSISTDNLSIFTFSDLGVFCNFLPTSQSAHTREKLIFINNDKYTGYNNTKKVLSSINKKFDNEKPYIMLKKVIYLKNEGYEHFILNIYKPEKYNI